MNPRSIRSGELQVVRWMLDRARTPAGANYDPSLTDLTVIDEWASVCIDFQKGGPGDEIIADAVAIWPNGNRAGVILWGRAGQVRGLEVYDQTVGASQTLPTIETLRTYAELGEAAAHS